ncbi:MAG TPA: class I SAM-dependent methyltransferase [Acidimicrobiales bacterium]|nr:class I SAM-dependent methyltransferase [Acidimicrobiales bacterium]
MSAPARGGVGPGVPDGRAVRAGFEAHYVAKWRDHQGFWVDSYPRPLDLYADLLRQRNAAILRAIPPTAGSVLDCGSGVGDLSALLVAQGADVVSLDVTAVHARRTRDNLRGQDGFHGAVVADAAALPFKAGTFDAVVLADVLEHLLDPVDALRECSRQLRGRGIVVIVTPDRRVLAGWGAVDAVAQGGLRAARAVARRVRGTRRAPVRPGTTCFERLVSRAEARQAVAAAGLEVVEHRRICFYPGPEGGGALASALLLLDGLSPALGRACVAALRPMFGAVERTGLLNQKQLLVARARP